MPRKAQYQPQSDENGGFDDPDQYMMLVRPFKNKNIPYLQILCPLLAVIFVTVGLAYDEISDGDLSFTSDGVSSGIDEVDYDCGWETWRVTIKRTGGTEQAQSIEYSSDSCIKTNDDIMDSDWCSSMEDLGKVWLGFNIVGLLLPLASIPVVYKLGKSSLVYFVLNFFGTICFLISIGNWLQNEKCSDMEEYSTTKYTVKTNLGVSLYLLFGALLCMVFALLVSSIHLVRKRTVQRQTAVQMGNVQGGNTDTAS